MLSSIFLCTYWPFVYLGRSVCSDPLPIFKLGYLSYYWVVIVVCYSRYKFITRYIWFMKFSSMDCLHFLGTKVFNFDNFQFIFFFSPPFHCLCFLLSYLGHYKFLIIIDILNISESHDYLMKNIVHIWNYTPLALVFSFILCPDSLVLSTDQKKQR